MLHFKNLSSSVSHWTHKFYVFYVCVCVLVCVCVRVLTLSDQRHWDVHACTPTCHVVLLCVDVHFVSVLAVVEALDAVHCSYQVHSCAWCVCVCVCVHVRACVRVCVCVFLQNLEMCTYHLRDLRFSCKACISIGNGMYKCYITMQVWRFKCNLLFKCNLINY